MRKLQFLTTLFAIALLLNSCDKNSTDVDPSLSIQVEDALQATLTDEYKAQIVYQRILDDFGADTRPFVNIKGAEIKHAEAIATLMNRYSIEVPVNTFKVADMESFTTVKDACALGVIAEEENIALYDSYLTLVLPSDVRNVFESNRSASLNNHLPAFQNCSK